MYMYFYPHTEKKFQSSLAKYLVLNFNYCLCFFTRLEIKTQAVKFSLIFLTCKYVFVKGLSSDMNKGFSHNLEMSGVLMITS